MTRINTNISSLNAQKSLARSNASLQEALTRLSTGLRINVGKDDPAGLIASEVLRSDIISAERAITNSERANQMIGTADSALGQVSSLLNDIRGLVTEAANEGALSEEQIAANQLQVDSSLEAINRIAQMTKFQGRGLLDGSLGFLTDATGGQNFDDITDLEINNATLDSNDNMDVEIEISSAAETAQITNATNPDATATATIDFGFGWQLSQGSATIGIYQRSGSAIAAPKIEVAVAGAEAVELDGTDSLKITILDDQGAAGKSNAQDIVDKINSVAGTKDDWFAYIISTGAKEFGTTAVVQTAMVKTTLQIDAAAAGPDLNNMAVEFSASSGQATDATYDADTNTLSLLIDSDAGVEADLTTLVTEIENIQIGGVQAFDATEEYNTNGRQGILGAGDGVDTQDADLSANTGYTGGGVLEDQLVLQLSGNSGVDVFNFQQYTKISAVVSAINLVSASTGVTATDNAGTLELESSEYGEDAFVAVKVVSEGAAGTFETDLSATRDTGSDIVATVNGYEANGNGNTLSVNTATLNLSATIAADSTDTIQFSITGGGAMFQLGPDVVSNQQARIGIDSVNTAQLGSVSGKLYELGSGESYSLSEDTTTAAKVVDEVIAKVASLRGRLGAFQKTTLDSNIATLNDTLENLSAAESSIRDADFAAESAALTRAQILVQSGTSVLAIANSNPQNVLALLR